MEQTLKVGDTVERINSDHGNFPKGSKGVIKFVTGDKCVLEGDRYGFSHSNDNLKKVEINEPLKEPIFMSQEVDGVLCKLFEINPKYVMVYDFINRTKSYHTGDFEMQIVGEVISKNDFLQLSMAFAHYASKVKEVSKPKKRVLRSKYHLYSDGISIFGFSEKSRKDLVDFMETYGRESGFRILDAKGITKGFVSAELFNSLSYHVQDLK